MQLIRRLKKIK